MMFLIKTSLKMLAALGGAAHLMFKFSRFKSKLARCFKQRKKESVIPMKKSYLVAVIAVLAAVAGALAAVAVYLHRREKELDEYERLLFGETEAEEEAESAAEAEPEADSASDESAAE